MLNQDVILEAARKWRGCQDWLARDGAITYLVKGEGTRVFKVGRSVNLYRRITALRNSFYFFSLDYALVAFCPGDIEEYVQGAIVHAGGTPLGKYGGKGKRPKEMFEMEDCDVDCIINAFSFQRVDNGMIPSGYKFSDDGEHDGYFRKYDVLGWLEPPRRRNLKNPPKKENGNA